MQTLKVHDKLSKAQRLMKGRRFRVLKEIDEEIEQEVYRKTDLPFFSIIIVSSPSSVHKTKKIALHPCVIMHHG